MPSVHARSAPAGYPVAEDEGPTPIRIGNLARWARATYRTDRREYRVKGAPIGPVRIARALAPRLDDAIFVVGAGRSGTSFLGGCLGALPEVGYHHEPVAAKAGARYVFEGTWSEPCARAFFRAVYAWLCRVHWDGHLRFAEKNPTNSFIIPQLARWFPRSQFVHIIRDGRDAALSHSRRPWLQAAAAGSNRREDGGYLCGPYPRFWVEPERRAEFAAVSDIRRCAWAWRRAVEAALRDGPPLGAARYHEVRYEALVESPASEADRLLDFLGIAAAESRRRFRDAAGEARARSVGGFRRDLDAAALADIQAEAGALLARLGYVG